jgi:hypothetical protein
VRLRLPGHHRARGKADDATERAIRRALRVPLQNDYNFFDSNVAESHMRTPNEKGFIRCAQAWWIKPVELNRWIQRDALCNLYDA